VLHMGYTPPELYAQVRQQRRHASWMRSGSRSIRHLR
jgi:hypothetical protein